MDDKSFFEEVANGYLSEKYIKFKDKWIAAANAISEQPTYYVKRAYIRFALNGNQYVMGAGSLGISNEQFEIIEREIEADLKSIGADKVCYCGMID